MKKGVLLMAVLCMLTFTPKVHADVYEAAKSEQYGTKAGGMLGRGLLNVVTCFVDLIVHTVEGTQDGPPFIGTMTGLGSGLGCTALRVTSGALDVLTFWVPGFNGMPVSKSYSNCMDFEEPAATEPAAGFTPPVTSYEPPAAAPVKKRHRAEDYVKK